MHLVANGDKAPGPNGQSLCRLLRENPSLIWAELRTLSRQLRDGTYQPGPTRRVEIPKASGRGTRTINVSNWQDQVVQRAIVQILDPLLDSQFDELSLGYRTGHDRFEAIVKAGVRIEREGRPVLLCADLTNAFSNIPHAPLLEEIERRLGSEKLTRLIGRIIRAENRRRGVAQGGSLSPLLLNLYLDRPLDQRWRRELPSIPLFRVADDLLVLCRSEEEAQHCLDELRRLLQPTGMKLNGTKTRIRHLEREPAEWLGFSLSLEHGGLQVNLPSDFYARVRERIRHAMSQPDGVLRAAETIQGIFDQLGPCYDTTPKEDVYRHLASLAARMEFDEFPDFSALMRIWQRSALRYLLQKRLWRAVYGLQSEEATVVGKGSASCQLLPACLTLVTRGSGIAAASPISAPMSSQATLTVIVMQSHGQRGWAFHLASPDQIQTCTRFETVERGSLIRCSLQGLSEGLKLIDRHKDVRIVTNSTYLCSNWYESAMQCLARGGKTLDGTVPANWDLLFAIIRQRTWDRVVIEYR